LQSTLYSPIPAALDLSRIDCAALNGGFLLFADEQLLLESKNHLAHAGSKHAFTAITTLLHPKHQGQHPALHSPTMQALHLATVAQALKDTATATEEEDGVTRATQAATLDKCK
jgi:hypothetical protein